MSIMDYYNINSPSVNVQNSPETLNEKNYFPHIHRGYAGHPEKIDYLSPYHEKLSSSSFIYNKGGNINLDVSLMKQNYNRNKLTNSSSDTKFNLSSINSPNHSIIKSNSKNILFNANISPSYKKTIFDKIGFDVLNSNRVLINFNKKNHLATRHTSVKKTYSNMRKKISKDVDNLIMRSKNPNPSESIGVIPPVTKILENINNNQEKYNLLNIENVNNEHLSQVNSNQSLILPPNLTEINESNITNFFTKDKSLNSSNVICNNYHNNNNINYSLIKHKKQKTKQNNENLKINFLNISKNTENIDNVVNFLREISLDNFYFNNNLKLFELFLDIELCVENYGISSCNNYGISTKKPHLFSTLKKFFYVCKQSINSDDKSEFFTFDTINKLFEKCAKLKIIVSCCILLTYYLTPDFGIKSQIKKITTSLTNPVINFFEFFIFGQINYNNSRNKFLRNDFSEKYTKILKYYRLNKSLKISDVMIIINRNLENSILSVKQFSKYNSIYLIYSSYFKFNQLKPFHNVLFDVLKNLENFSIFSISELMINNILFSILDFNFTNVRVNTSNKPESNKLNNYNDRLPYLPCIQSQFIYTLVLDLDETLVHYFYTQNSGIFLVRPYTKIFLQELCEMYEIVIFTAGTKEYADDILDKLDPDKTYIKHRLYRNHTSTIGLNIIKDLNKLGRDLSKVIIVDNIPENFKNQPNNGLMIKTWFDDINDNQLLEIKHILKDIFIHRVSDIRLVIKKVKEYYAREKCYSNVDITFYV